MTGDRPGRPAPGGRTQLERAGQPRPAPAVLVAVVGTVAEAGQAIAAGADLIDASGLTGQDVAVLRARHPGLRLWHGSPAAADAGQPTGDAGQATAPAAVVATAAVLAWLGIPAIRTRHVLPVRRAIDMTCSIAGTRLPAITTRGLA